MIKDKNIDDYFNYEIQVIMQNWNKSNNYFFAFDLNTSYTISYTYIDRMYTIMLITQHIYATIIGYKRVGDCTYPTLTGHTLRSENIKLIQLVKAIKSNIETEKKLNNTSGGRYEELRENKEEKRSKEEMKSKVEKENIEEKESKEGRKNDEERERDRGRDGERENESKNKINSKQDQSMKILENRTHNAADDHLDVLDVD